MCKCENKFMLEAIKEAKAAGANSEVPIGAVIVKNGSVIAYGRNRRETEKNALAHAEIEAINNACAILGGWRLVGCDMYVTLEPCPMCMGAIVNSRIEALYFGAYDKKSGACGSLFSLTDHAVNHKPNIKGGVMENECSLLLKDFFKKLRKKEN